MWQSGKLKAGDDGIVGVSAAEASAEGGNNAPIEMVAGQPGQELSQGIGEAQQYLPTDLGWTPSAFAFAEADRVDITTEKIDAGGTGVVAISVADADAEADDGRAVAIAISDDVNVTIGGNVKAGGTGVFAASFAKADAHGGYTYTEQGNVTVSVEKGTVSGGNADGKAHYGIVVLGGDENLIEIGKKGAVTSKSHLAIYGGDQHETIRNYGLVDGSVVLNEAGLDGDPQNFYNYGSGKFYSGSVIDLGGNGDGLLYNAGALSPGGPGTILRI